jgi:hypothetical protein
MFAKFAEDAIRNLSRPVVHLLNLQKNLSRSQSAAAFRLVNR